MLKTEKKAVVFVFIFLLAFTLVFANVIDTKSVLLKFSLHKGESTTKNFSISSSAGGEINLALKGVDKGVTLVQSDVVLDKGEEKSVQVLFNTTDLNEGVYVGHIEANSGREVDIIPIIFEVESKDVFFDSNLEIPVKYSEIAPGGKLVAQMNVFDLFGGTKSGLNSSSVDVDYTVHDLNGNNIISEHETVVVDDQISVTKTMIFPKDIQQGQYVFSAVLNYKSSYGIASEMFTISNKPQFEFSGTGAGLSGSGIVLIFAAFIFLVLILFFVYMIRDRDRMFLELRQYNNEEMQRQKEFLNAQANVLKTRGASEGKIKKEIDNTIEKIKEKQEERVDEFKKLKKVGNISQMKRKLAEWKRKGYNTTLMEYKLKNLSTKEMKEALSEWKKKYKG